MKEKNGHGVQLLIRAVVRDPDGKVISDTGKKPARSFLIQFLEFMYGVFRGTNSSATSTALGEQLIYYTAYAISATLQIDGGVGDVTKGIVVGTGDTAVTNDDNKLETALTEGTGAGNITHGAMTIGSAAEVGANVDIVLKRSFTNNTGSSITVNEAGIYTFLPATTHCIVRDVLGGGVVVPDKCTLTVFYTVRTTV